MKTEVMERNLPLKNLEINNEKEKKFVIQKWINIGNLERFMAWKRKFVTWKKRKKIMVWDFWINVSWKKDDESKRGNFWYFFKW